VIFPLCGNHLSKILTLLRKKKMEKLSKSLLEEILKINTTHANEPNAIKFRAEKYEYLDVLDKLESEQYIERDKGNYRVKLKAILELSDSVVEAKNILSICECIFKTLKQFYLKKPGEHISLKKLSEISELLRKDVNAILPYMIDATTIFHGWSINFYADDAHVSPAERILRYKSFQDVLEEIKSWYTKSSLENKEKLTCNDRKEDDVKDFQFLLHPEIKRHALSQYNNGHLREAVLNSIMAVFDLIRNKTGLKDDGDKLIGKAFSLSDPYLILSEIDHESGQNDQKGFMQIYKGSFQGIRNPKAHSLTHDLNKLKAAQYLVFASLLARRVDEATVIKTEKK
jgi:uncharacterized protein (TIGR02391 family)